MILQQNISRCERVSTHVRSQLLRRPKQLQILAGRFFNTCQSPIIMRNKTTLGATQEEATIGTNGSPLPEFPWPQPIPQKDVILLQAFGWESCKKSKWYSVIESRIKDFKEAGITHVWLPPPSSSPVSDQGYMPGQLYNLTSKYGNEAELIALNTALMSADLNPLADIVINHRCACQQVNGVWNKFGDDVDHDGHRINWDQWAITSDDPHFKGTGNPDTGEDFGPAPDLDHMNPALREGLTHWLQYLNKGVGFTGWRLDYVKGFGATYVHEYIMNSVGEKGFNVGEYWTDLQWTDGDLAYNQDAARQKLCDWVDGCKKSAAAFDFPTKGILQQAVKMTRYDRLKDSQGKAAGLIGWWPAQAVTFVDNHDTGSSQAHWPFPKEFVGLGYAYILTHPGIPCIFWEHMFDWGDELKKSITNLVSLRKRAGINAESKVEILCAEHDMYLARINGNVVIKLGPRMEVGSMRPRSADGWTVAASGRDFAVWEKTGK